MPDTHQAPPFASEPQFPPLAGIDLHAHVFERTLPMMPGRRYAPNYDATLPDYLSMLSRSGLSHGVLVQPSFLGVDNTYLVAALCRLPDRLRGIAVVKPDVDDATLDELNGAGCVGARLNLIGRPNAAFSDPEWQRHLHRPTRLHWQVEVQAEAARLPLLLPPLLDAGLTVVVDHFGRPNVEEGGERSGLSLPADGRARRPDLGQAVRCL